MKTISFLLTITTSLTLVSCYSYETASSYHVPSSPAKKASSQKNAISPGGVRRGSVKFPTRIAIARVETQKYRDDVRLFDGRNLEKPEHAATISQLPGIAGIVSLNNISLQDGGVSYSSLRQEALEVGAPLLAVYRFTTTHETIDHSGMLNIAALGILPTVGHQVVSNVSLIVQDARTGYTYGVLEEQASTKLTSTQWGIVSSETRARRKTRQAALDQLMEKLPCFWDRIVR